mgnify:CR=1 FL=1
MNLTIHVWRQKSREAEGGFVTYKAGGISPDASFLEMLDVVNEQLIEKGEESIHFEHDCRAGICGSCGRMINGVAHGSRGNGLATCQLHMRRFKDDDEIWIEPWRARAFPVIKDLIVDRSALDTIIQAGGFISVNTGSAPSGPGIRTIASSTGKTLPSARMASSSSRRPSTRDSPVARYRCSPAKCAARRCGGMISSAIGRPMTSARL